MADTHIASAPSTRIAAEAQVTLDRQPDGHDRLRQIEEAAGDTDHHQAAEAEARPVAQVGSRVTISGAKDSEVEMTIVGSHQDGGLHRLSTRSPLAKALIGHRAGDEVKVHTQAGAVSFTVVQVDQ